MFGDRSTESELSKLLSSRSRDPSRTLSTQSALLLFLNVVAGSCLGLGLVFAGTTDETAASVLLVHLKLLQWCIFL